MIQTCAKCSRVNPNDAIYCYYDGFVLGGHNRDGGPVAIGSMPFNSPFVFPDGHACRSFNELARACNLRWNEASNLLQKGLIESFLTGLGRLDLVMAAQEARKFPDPDRALDQLLGRLPCDREALAPPQLQVETKELNLGTLEPGVDRTLEIQIENAGERLLYGDITVRVPDKQLAWLSLEEKPGTTQRSFQFQDRMTLKVHLDRDRLRASDKPLVATLAIDSSGGTAAIQIKASVPVKPFPESVLKGAKTPRRIAELAKEKPRDAAPLFESGTVASWYKSNGWEYPVQGPSASGLGAVQQFFEALGLAPAPKVSINTKRIDWTGPIGSTLEQEIVLLTNEKKYVYAHGVSDHPWVQADRAELKGPRATIRVRVPSVPDQPGETLTATLTVQSNGDQRFLIPISLAIPGTPRKVQGTAPTNAFNFDEEEEPVPVMAVEEEAAPVVAVVEAVENEPVAVVAVVEEGDGILPGEVATVAAVDAPGDSFDFSNEPPARAPSPRSEPARVRGSESKTSSDDKPAPSESRRRTGKGSGNNVLVHLMPLGLLIVSLGLLAVWDYFNPEIRSRAGTSDLPTLELIYDRSTDRYALELFDPLDKSNLEKRKSLFPTLRGQSKPTGTTGNVGVRFGGSGPGATEYLFGTPARGIATRTSQGRLPSPRTGFKTTFLYEEFQVEVTQEIELVSGLSESLDTCLVKYTVENKGANKQIVGLRVLLDTYIGTNDGVPFTIPGESGFVTEKRVLNLKEVPQYIEAIENPDDPKNPGSVLRIGLQFPDSELESPVKVLICGYQNSFKNQRWDLDPIADIKKDSCVAIFWAEAPINQGEKRVLGYSYGLGEVQGDGRLALSAPAVVTPNSEFVLTTYVYKAEKGQSFKVLLPEGMSLPNNEDPEKTVAANAERAILSWRVRAGSASKEALPIRVEGAGTSSRPVRVQVRDRSIFG